MLHIIETCLPLNGRLYIFRDALHLKKKRYILQGIREEFMKLFQGYNIRCTYVSICLVRNCVFTFMIIYGSLTLMYLLNCIQ